MKIKILLMVILLLSICSIIYGKCILKHKEVESYLAVLEGPKELVLEKFAVLHGCPEDKATSLVEYLIDPHTEKSLEWAGNNLKKHGELSYETATSAYIIGINRNPPVTEIAEIFLEYDIPFVGEPRKIVGYAINIYGKCKNKSYPVVEIDDKYKRFVLGGLKCNLSQKEISDFKKILMKDIEEDPDSLTLFRTTVKAYINQTGDMDFMNYLWSHDYKSLCIHLAEISTDPRLTRFVLDLTDELYIQNDKEGEGLRISIIGIFHEQKKIPEVAQRIREILKIPGLYYEYRNTLISILGSEGWNQNQLRMNKMFLELYLESLDRTIKNTENTLDHINSLLNSSAYSQ